MKKVLLTLIALLITSPSFSAELLVMAESGSHWSHAKKGDVVAVREDGHKWGKKECLPLFVVVKVPDMTVEEARIYEEQLTEEVEEEFEGETFTRQEVIRDRKYSLPETLIDEVKTSKSSEKKIESKDLKQFKKDIVEKNKVAEKLAVDVLKTLEKEEKLDVKEISK